MSVVVDSTLLSNFAAVARLDLLETALGTAYVAAAVRTEVSRGASRHPHLVPVEQLLSQPSPGWLRVITAHREADRRLLRSLPSGLHRGEAESLVIARRQRWLILTDDGLARRTAVRLGIELAGTLGVLTALADDGDLTLDDANRLLRQMIDLADYRSPVDWLG